MNKYLVMISLVGIAVVFQNCSDQSFSSRADMNKPLSVESDQLVEEEIPDVIKDDVDDRLDDDKDKDGHRDVATDEPKKYDDSDDDDDKDSAKEEPKKYGSSGDDDDDKDISDKKTDKYVKKDESKKRISCKNRGDGNARFVCILAGPGKSTHVAVVDDKIVESNSTPKTACMSEHACEEIVGKKLTVKSVENRGYCKNGTPQVLLFSDVDIQRLMDKAQ